MIYEIKFSKGQQKVLAESSASYELGEQVIVQSKKGHQWGEVLRKIDKGNFSSADGASLVRKADERDQKAIARLEEMGKAVKVQARQLVQKHGLDMKIIETCYNLEQSQLFISFTAESRVDFRELLKDMAQSFHSRIELRQIGARDAAKIRGGVGPCGRPLCCSSFIYEFPNVSIKMAKNQQLSLKQSKLNGLCGRLMCCLSYEDDFYKEAQKAFPDWGTRVQTESGAGKVIGLNVLGGAVKVRLDADRVMDFKLAEIEVAHG